MDIPGAQTLTNVFLPSLEAMGLFAYWVIGVASLLEAFFVTGIVLPGSIVVDLGGVLVHRGMLDFLDLVWFVAIGSWLGSILSFWTGRRIAAGGSASRFGRTTSSAPFRKALAMFERHGALAILLGRFSGPLAGLVPFAAGLSGMKRRPFLVFSGLGAVPYAFIHVSLGYGASEIFGRISPAVTRDGLALLVILLLMALVWYLVSRAILALPWLVLVLSAAARGILAEPLVAGWMSRHPRLTDYVQRRLSVQSFGGLPLTLSAAVILILLGLYLASAIDFLSGDPIVRADANIAGFLHALQSPAGVRLATYVTALGDGRVVGIILIGSCLSFWLAGHRALAVGMSVSVLGQAVTVPALKQLFDRERPSVAHFLEMSPSFPSGHATVSVALFGFLAYALFRAKVIRPGLSLMIAGMCIVAIGFSRMYLGVHYLSDVVNGFLVGSIWLTIGISTSEWLLSGRLPQTSGRKTASLLVALPTAVAAAALVAFYDKAQAPPVPSPTPIVVSAASDIFYQLGFDPSVESLIGTDVEPVTLVFIASGPEELTAAFEKAGWSAPSPPSISRLIDAALAAWTNRPDPVAPITPYFRDGRPNDLSFQKPDASDTLRRRHHVRIWRSPYQLGTGEDVYVASASYDDGLKWGFLHHISPDLDRERDAILSDLAATGSITTPVYVTETGPRTGFDEFGDPWFTDGRVAIADVTLR